MKFIVPDYAQLLEYHHLKRFSDIWNVEVDWFEEPNQRRGGWGGVGKLTLSDNGLNHGIFLKRQQNHLRKTFKHPFSGLPTFAAEYEMIQHLAKHQVPSLKIVAFGVRRSVEGYQSILMTEELVGFESLEICTEKIFASKPSLSEQNLIIRQVATTVAKLHKSGIQHRSLYPKHLFIDKNFLKNVVVIDLENSRLKFLPLSRTICDLATLNRHAKHWTKTRRLYFYLQYLGLKRLNPFYKLICRLIIKRSNRAKKSR